MTVFRKSATSLSAPEAARYVAVVSQLISRPDNPYGVLVGYHADMTHDMHPGRGAIISPGDPNKATSTSRRKKLQKEQDDLKKQQAELLAFEEKLKHAADQKINLDFDDGVKVNYAKFGDLLAESKAICGTKDED